MCGRKKFLGEVRQLLQRTRHSRPPVTCARKDARSERSPYRYRCRVQGGRQSWEHREAMTGTRVLTIKTDFSLGEDSRGLLSGCCKDKLQGIRHARLSTVATSRVISVRALLVLRLSCLTLLVLGGGWVAWESITRHERSDGEPPPMLCLPDWSYVITVLYFVMAVLACLRQNSILPFTPHSSVTVSAGEAVGRSLANTATLFFLEVSVVFQTIVVPLSWIGHSDTGDRAGRATMSSVALAAVLADLFLNQSRVEAKHVWAMLGVLLAWAIEQVVWVHSSSTHRSCYRVFDVTGPESLLTAVVGAGLVAAVAFAYAAICAQRDSLMAQFVTGANAEHTGPDVEEDVGQENEPTPASALPVSICPPLSNERKSIMNPIFAGSGSRMNRSWPNQATDNRPSLGSSATDMSSGEEVDPVWQEGEGNKQGTRALGAEVLTLDAESKAEFGTNGSAFPQHPSSWAGYGGAAAWVRASSRDTTPMSKTSKGSMRKGLSRF